MFSLKIERVDQETDDPWSVITLEYRSDTICFNFVPENTDNLKAEDFGSENCNFSWTAEKVCFELHKYGDGEGGCMKIQVPLEGQTRESFDRALVEWREELVALELLRQA